MTADPGSHSDGQKLDEHKPAPDPDPDTPDPDARHPKSERFWSWVRVGLFLLAAIGFGIPGYLLRPRPEPPLTVIEPTITVLADQPHVTAMVDMTLSATDGPPPQYTLKLTITPTSSTPQPVQIAVEFGSFPTQASGTSLSSLPSGNSYTVVPLLAGSSAAASTSQPFTYTSSQRIGEATDGLRLRVVFPDLVNETPSTQFSSSSSPACASGEASSESQAAICTSLGSQWFQPALEAGTTTLSSDSTGLANYEYVAGDTPTLVGGNGWIWNGINGVTMLATDVAAQDNQQNDLFYSGIYLGVAAGALIACVTELLRPAWRKGKDESTAKRAPQNQAS